MTIKFILADGKGTANVAKITPQGEILVRQLKFGEVQFQAMDAINTAFNFFLARAGERFVITGVLVNTNKDIGVNGAIVDIYEASSTSSTTIDAQILRLNILKNDTVIFPGVFFAVTEGKFLNGKTDDATVNVSIGGYFIDV